MTIYMIVIPTDFTCSHRPRDPIVSQSILPEDKAIESSVIFLIIIDALKIQWITVFLLYLLQTLFS